MAMGLALTRPSLWSFRQVRKMFNAIDHPVMNLKRVALGKININNVEVGKYRHLTEDEVNYLKNATNNRD